MIKPEDDEKPSGFYAFFGFFSINARGVEYKTLLAQSDAKR